MDTVPLVSVLMRFDCDTDTCVMWNSVSLVSVLRKFECNTGIFNLGTLSFLCLYYKEGDL